MNELALFAGAGGSTLAGKLLGWRTVCAVENDPYSRDVLVARQNDGCLPPFPIWDDIRTFDGRSWNGIIDIISGGFPCQDISGAGLGGGICGPRSGLWSEMARIIGEVQPRYVLVENVPFLVSRGLGLVLTNLAEIGYDAWWTIVGAHNAGAPHHRERLWILATNTNSERGRGGEAGVENAINVRQSPVCKGRLEWWSSEPNVDRVGNGLAARVDRLRCIGNGWVPDVARIAFQVLK